MAGKGYDDDSVWVTSISGLISTPLQYNELAAINYRTIVLQLHSTHHEVQLRCFCCTSKDKQAKPWGSRILIPRLPATFIEFAEVICQL